MTIEALGYAAGVLTTIAFVPQVWRIWTMKSAHEISWAMFVIFNVGIVLWLIYGIALVAWPLIFANSATLVLALTVLALKWRYGRAR
jgi:MtN3 and saliva related transmembrane protein